MDSKSMEQNGCVLRKYRKGYNLQHIRSHYVGDTMSTESCFNSSIGESLMPKDWMFLPLIELYNMYSTVGAEVQNILSTSQLETVRNVLRWIYLMESCRTLLLEGVSVALKLSRIMCAFLTGCIDGVLIPIQTPYEDEASYVCRKGFHALNVQAIADADMRFINIVVRWSGATHDSFILTNSQISQDLSQRNGWLLGDSGYPLKAWLMTPYLRPANNQQQNFNVAHARTRNVVERSFGVLKARFRFVTFACFSPKF